MLFKISVYRDDGTPVFEAVHNGLEQYAISFGGVVLEGNFAWSGYRLEPLVRMQTEAEQRLMRAATEIEKR